MLLAAAEERSMTNLFDATFVVIDTETTGLDTASDELVEVAAAVYERGGSANPLAMFATLVRPEKTIPPDVSAIHHLRNCDLVVAPRPATVLVALEAFIARQAPDSVLVAHNLAFDLPFLTRADEEGTLAKRPALCTRRLAQHLVTDAPTYKNQGLRYYFDLEVDTFGIMPHRALADVLVTGAVLQHLFLMGDCPQTVEELIALSASPIEYQRMPFGKHRDAAINEVPTDYISWCLRTTDLDPDLRWSLEQSLKRRGALAQ
jgi:exodeoxyribonuclease X